MPPTHLVNQQLQPMHHSLLQGAELWLLVPLVLLVLPLLLLVQAQRREGCAAGGERLVPAAAERTQ